MNTLKTHKKTWTAGVLALLLVAPAVVVLQGCTDLGEETFGVVTPDQFYETDEEILAAVAPLYAGLRGSLWAYHNLSQVSSDETVVPTRGSDWFDNGRWISIHEQSWDPSLTDLNDAWNQSYTGVARANGLLQQLEGAEEPNPQLLAEIRTLRAFYYYQLLDLFGNIPLVGDEEGEYLVDPENPPATVPRADVFAFIESELVEVREDLPESWDAGNFARVTQYVADAILANMYVNAEVFTGEVTVDGLQRGTARWQEAIDAADRVLNSGQFSLAEDWFSNFDVENQNSPELIFVVQHLPEDGLGLTFQHRPLHYNQLDPSPWNGFATLAETYGQFDEADTRREIFLIGQAYSFETGEPVNNRQGEPLVFTPEIGDITSATEGEGIRILKFDPDLDNQNGNHGNDYAFFRLAEMYLIKAEALNELNRTGEAIALLNELRERVYDPPQPLSTGLSQEALRTQILRERLHEMTYEAKRRQDLIRIPVGGGPAFLRPWQFKDQSEPYRVLMPIPQAQIDANPNLDQNSGY